MSTIEKFDISKANLLCDLYLKNAMYSHQKLLRQLITWQLLFSEKSIIGEELSIPFWFRKCTVEEVLYDMGYKLNYFYSHLCPVPSHLLSGIESKLSFSKIEE